MYLCSIWYVSSQWICATKTNWLCGKTCDIRARESNVTAREILRRVIAKNRYYAFTIHALLKCQNKSLIFEATWRLRAPEEGWGKFAFPTPSHYDQTQTHAYLLLPSSIYLFIFSFFRTVLLVLEWHLFLIIRRACHLGLLCDDFVVRWSTS